jgi:hypothetical protein
VSFSLSSRGSFNKTESWLKGLVDGNPFKVLEKFGRVGVEALSEGTPKETGETANAWYYEVEHSGGNYSIIWKNRHVVDGQQIAILLQYGHGTGTGGYVEGRDYINPKMRPIFDRMAEAAWKEVTSR